MIDLIVRDCGYGEWLPIIQVVGTTRDSRFGNGEELYRGERHRSHEAAWNKVVATWETSATGNIVAFKKERGLS